MRKPTLLLNLGLVLIALTAAPAWGQAWKSSDSYTYLVSEEGKRAHGQLPGKIDQIGERHGQAGLDLLAYYSRNEAQDNYSLLGRLAGQLASTAVDTPAVECALERAQSGMALAESFDTFFEERENPCGEGWDCSSSGILERLRTDAELRGELGSGECNLRVSRALAAIRNHCPDADVGAVELKAKKDWLAHIQQVNAELKSAGSRDRWPPLITNPDLGLAGSWSDHWGVRVGRRVFDPRAIGDRKLRAEEFASVDEWREHYIAPQVVDHYETVLYDNLSTKGSCDFSGQTVTVDEDSLEELLEELGRGGDPISPRRRKP